MGLTHGPHLRNIPAFMSVLRHTHPQPLPLSALSTTHLHLRWKASPAAPAPVVSRVVQRVLFSSCSFKALRPSLLNSFIARAWQIEILSRNVTESTSEWQARPRASSQDACGRKSGSGLPCGMRADGSWWQRLVEADHKFLMEMPVA